MSASAWVWLAVREVALIAAGAYLVTHGCPWWGALCFLLVAGTTVRNVKTEDVL